MSSWLWPASNHIRQREQPTNKQKAIYVSVYEVKNIQKRNNRNLAYLARSEALIVTTGSLCCGWNCEDKAKF